jgi:hypothetical protein
MENEINHLKKALHILDIADSRWTLFVIFVNLAPVSQVEKWLEIRMTDILVIVPQSLVTQKRDQIDTRIFLKPNIGYESCFQKTQHKATEHI